MRARIRTTLEGHGKLNLEPIELHDQILNNLEYRYCNLVKIFRYLLYQFVLSRVSKYSSKGTWSTSKRTGKSSWLRKLFQKVLNSCLFVYTLVFVLQLTLVYNYQHILENDLNGNKITYLVPNRALNEVFIGESLSARLVFIHTSLT